MKRLLVLATSIVSVLALAVPASGAVQEKATGSVVSSYPFAIDFAVFEEPMKGNLTYTDFVQADPGSGMWKQDDATIVLAVEYLGAPAGSHVLNIESWTVVSPTKITFSGTGYAGGGWTTAFEGSIVGDLFTVTMKVYGNGYGEAGDVLGPITTWWSGAIAAGGIVDGTWHDDWPLADGVASRGGTFDATNEFHEVFSFSADVTCVRVKPDLDRAKFGYTIPADAPAGLAGQSVVVKVIDGGSPGTQDTYMHNFALGEGSCQPVGDAYVQYTIVAGNLTVHG